MSPRTRKTPKTCITPQSNNTGQTSIVTSNKEANADGHLGPDSDMEEIYEDNNNDNTNNDNDREDIDMIRLRSHSDSRQSVNKENKRIEETVANLDDDIPDNRNNDKRNSGSVRSNTSGKHSEIDEKDEKQDNSKQVR